MIRIRCLFLGIFLQPLFLLFFTTPAAICSDSITIGVIGAMKFAYGQELWNGAVMAADEINQRGGVRVGQKRMPIKLIKANTNEFLNVAYATNTMEMLLFRNKVDFVVGGFRSEAVQAMQDVAMDYKKLYISIGAALPDLCTRVAQNYDRYKYFFRGGLFNSNYLGKACLLQLDYVANILREELGIRTIKVAIAAEKAGWVEEMIVAAEQNFSQMGLELTGVFRSSTVATDVSSEIQSIAATKASIVLTLFSSNVGVAFVTQAVDAKLPAAMVGINVEAQKGDFWDRTQGKAEYVMTTAAFCQGVEINDLTKPFVKNYTKRFGEMPTFNSGTYTAIMYTLVPAIEQAGTLNTETLVKIIENREYETPHGLYAYEKDELGRHLHDLKFGAENSIMLGIQWQNGKMKGVWPNKYIEKTGAQPITYKGIVDYKIPPLVMSSNHQ